MKDNILNKKFKYCMWNTVPLLVLINVLVYSAVSLFHISIKGIPLIYWLSLVPVFVRSGYVWQFATYMFVHNSVWHLVFNMYALIMFGMMLEKELGSKEFLLFYFTTGILAGVLSYFTSIITGSWNSVVLGASGAIYGLLFLTAVFYPRAGILLFFVLPLRMPVAILVFTAIELISQITGAAGGVAHLVHLSGMLIAWLFCLVRFRIDPIKVWKES